MYDDLFLFIKVVKCGSFTKASKELGIYQSTISRRIFDLEEKLNNKLVIRHANRFEFTKAGLNLFNSLCEQESKILNLVHNALNEESIIAGEINVRLPRAMSHKIIIPYLHNFLTQHPQLKIQIHHRHYPNLQKSNIDFALAGEMPTALTQKVKVLANVKFIVYCTPKYVEKYGFPKSTDDISDISQHKVLPFVLDSGEVVKSIKARNLKTGELRTIYT